MKGSTRGSGIPAGGAHALLRLLRVIVSLGTMLLSALVATAAASGAPKDNPHLASLQIEIWPEYDRPAAALVILRGEIAADVALPAAVSLRIPAATGGPSAVAYSASPSSDVFNLKYSRNDAGDAITLRFDAPERHFHVEFYEPLVTTGASRSYTYGWKGDLAADRSRVILQVPATASEPSVQPALGTATIGRDGLRYRSTELGPLAAGVLLEVQVRYEKTDARTSTELLNARAPEISPPTTAGPSKGQLALWLVAIVLVLVLGGIATSMLWSRRKSTPQKHPGQLGLCPRCATPSASGDRFCSKCGAPLA